MSSFLASVRRLFDRDDRDVDERESKRPKREALAPLPPDYQLRVTSLTQSGWSRAQGMMALDRNELDVEKARAWLNQTYPRPKSSASSSAPSIPVARTPMDLDLKPCVHERLPPLPHRPSIPSVTSLGSVSSQSTSSYISSSSPFESQSNSPMISNDILMAPSAPDLVSPPPPGWSCSGCTFINHGALNVCEVCETPRDTATIPTASSSSSSTPSREVDCLICYTSLPRDRMFMPNAASSCGHYGCESCMRQYVSYKIDSGLVQNLHCPGDGCKRVLGEDEIRTATDEYDFARYIRFSRLQILQNDPQVIFCPKTGCDIALRYTNQPKLNCPCGTAVCFVCKVPWHIGQTCAQFQLAKTLETEQSRQARMSSEDRLFERFIEKNKDHFRQCASCKSMVEHVEGCWKMTCRCGFQWCFKCGSVGANCNCTPMGHIFFPHSEVLRNWGRGNGRAGSASAVPAPFPMLQAFRLPGFSFGAAPPQQPPQLQQPQPPRQSWRL